MNRRHALNALRDECRRDYAARQIERERQQRERQQRKWHDEEIEGDSNANLGLHQGIQR